ncbi:MAG: hypothetical protein QNI84_02055 [Henriciella sp.]|nr:hypothetical protein [Henriciella sp.]
MLDPFVPVPPAESEPFRGGIVHPKLWLWDSWCCSANGVSHLFCLALNRRDQQGNPIQPIERNSFSFHIRHFVSNDEGQSWRDQGCVLRPSTDPNSFYAKSVWSGGVMPLPDGRLLMGFTGIPQKGPNRNFFQSIGLAHLDSSGRLISVQPEPISCPERDYDTIVRAGYYLGPRDSLGSDRGEEGGPIMAWRDPFIYVGETGQLEAIWSAKISPNEGAIARATLVETSTGFELGELLPPVRLPSAESYAQTEVPKLYHDPTTAGYLLLISSCDRMYEGQPDSEVSKRMRLYSSRNVAGPWSAFRVAGSEITNDGLLFGGSLLNAEFKSGQLTFVTPVTEEAEADRQLTIGPLAKLDLNHEASFLNSQKSS